MKADLRKVLRRARRALTPAEHARRSMRAAAVIARMAAFKPGSRIAAYLPFDAETDTQSLLRAARRRGVRIYVPVVSDLRHRRLRFYPIGAHTRPGTFGIAIPHRMARGARTPVGARWFDLIVVPLVGVDPQGRRLGMGGGFYDRVLEFRRNRQRWRGPRLVGLAFDCQRAESVGAQHWDLRLDCLATESGLDDFPGSAR